MIPLIVSTTVGILTIVGFLWRIAWTLGQLVQRTSDHAEACEKIHEDQEARIRVLERRRQLPRRQT